ncbi:protein shuttle craft-like [Chelonus insularis]|uniref:protein shuttle craft-like n=1 Tax=Chelonus insularis TaxID=460826 RepID=UPI00158832B7|nr:protein shuttle craft-like [Chelonus insularis]
MATWDGSFQGESHEDDYYYHHSDSQNVSSNQQSWKYYNASSNYVDNSTVNQQKNFNFSTGVFQNYQDASVNSNTSSTNNSNYYIEDNRLPSNFYTQQNYQVDISDDSKPRNFDSYSISHSNLHPDANEFVPSNRKPVEYPKTFFADNQSRYNHKKYDNRKNNEGYRQQSNDYLRSSYKHYEKHRKDHTSSNHTFTNETYSNSAVPEDHLNIKESNEEEFKASSSNDSSKGYKGRKNRNDGRFQNDRFSNSRYYNNGTTSTSNYQNNSNRWRNTSSLNDIGDGEKLNRSKLSVKESVSKDPRDEKYRPGSSSTGYNNYGEHSEMDRTSKKDKRRAKGKDATYSDEYRNDKFRNWRNSYEEKNSKSRKNHQTNYREGYDHDSKFDKSEKVKEDDKPKENSTNREEKPVNWRLKSNTNRMKKINKADLDDASSQRERLTEQLNRGQLECLVCCDSIRQNDSIWSCDNCYHVLHLKCIKKWAESSQSESGWRCPACQNANLAIPEDYNCFCGKTKDPEWNRRDVAHSCGEVCGRKRRAREKNICVHKCTLLCHPGSCPLCIAIVTRYCGCERTSQNLKCSTDTQLLCDAVCEKLLNCGIHKCERQCHHDNCGPCTKTIHQECFCGKHNRDVACLPNTPSMYTCEDTCNKLLECGNHYCKEKCHPGACGTCSLKPEIVTHCPCGQTLLTIKRESCLDPIPTCDKICSKQLKCGQPSSPHSCKALCHTGDCPQCDLTTWVKCRCGNMDREIPCSDLTTKADDARCEKKCTKKRSCGKHKCNQLCCIDIEHICPLPCSKTLSCGRHKCELTCHKGRCQPCYRSSFEELFCECGAAVIYPPVACGTRRPTCSQPCSRQHSCGHEVLHNCHSEASCPPCTVLTQKWCYGKHELRKAVPCYYNEISCGMPCGKPISCGRHKCITLCHPGPCEKPGQVCVQPCTTPRELCGHICAAPCHEGKCPDTPCKEMVKVTCTCGHRSMTRACAENSQEYQRIASGILASKMADMQLGHSVDLEEVFGQSARKQNQLKTLECNDECKIIERNRKLALGLQIANPDLSSKLLPRYSDFMKQWAKKDPSFCQMVHEKLTELVQLAKTSKQKSRSYSFDSMNREKRQFVHEACEHFGCGSQAYDQEPKRNVVATAVKDKCWLPSYSLLEMVQRENGQRKVPRPMLNSTKTNTLISRTSEVLPSTAKKTQMLQPSTSSSKVSEQEIDYFDYSNSKGS